MPGSPSFHPSWNAYHRHPEHGRPLPPPLAPLLCSFVQSSRSFAASQGPSLSSRFGWQSGGQAPAIAALVELLSTNRSAPIPIDMDRTLSSTERLVGFLVTFGHADTTLATSSMVSRTKILGWASLIAKDFIGRLVWVVPAVRQGQATRVGFSIVTSCLICWYLSLLSGLGNSPPLY